MRKKPFVLWLVWQNQETRQRSHIGNLTHNDGNVRSHMNEVENGVH